MNSTEKELLAILEENYAGATRDRLTPTSFATQVTEWIKSQGFFIGRWRPIEGAQKDGTHYLLYWPEAAMENRITAGYYWKDDDEEYWMDVNDHFEFHQPTHFMELPELPKEDK